MMNSIKRLFRKHQFNVVKWFIKNHPGCGYAITNESVFIECYPSKCIIPVDKLYWYILLPYYW